MEINKEPAIQNAVGWVARALLETEAEKTGATVAGIEDPNVAAWVASTSEQIMLLLSVVTLLPLPVAPRERLTAVSLLGGPSPMEIEMADVENALGEMRAANEVLPFDGGERALFEGLNRIAEALGNADGDAPALLTGYESEWLNEQLPGDMPDWLNDHIDYERIYKAVIDQGTHVDLPFADYTILGLWSR